MRRQGWCWGGGNKKDPFFLSSQCLHLVQPNPRTVSLLRGSLGKQSGDRLQTGGEDHPGLQSGCALLPPCLWPGSPFRLECPSFPLECRGPPAPPSRLPPFKTPPPSAALLASSLSPAPIAPRWAPSRSALAHSTSTEWLRAPQVPGTHCSGGWRHHRELADKGKDNKHVNK